ncbi:MAG TPA: sodium ion-translocating decarboxylase subunit beta, partial [Bacillota bacterium]|nr:sodium ion-translocating decarboxylase subunit beta [Bacillota bacterium]
MLDTIFDFIKTTGIVNMDYKSAIMIGVAILFLYLAIHHGFEPLLLVPIAFGMLLSNLPLSGMFDEGGLFYWFYQLNKMGILPPLIFMGVGAMTDFGPLIANPRSLLMGAGAQFGIFTSFLGAILLAGFNAQEAASIGIIGGADGPTAIFLTTKLAPHLLGAIAVSAYSYMALVPVIQPPIMRILTTKKERTIKMEQLR